MSGRYAIRKIDENQPEIVKALRGLGFSVQCTHMVSHGFTDLVAAKNGLNFVIEVKDGKKRKSDRQLTRDEKVFHENWKGPITILESLDDVVAFNARVSRMRLVEAA